jgi:predicted DNA-binding transcriptional regulator AlpA
MTPQLITARAVAAMLGISQRAVYQIPEADLPRYRLGAGRGAVRFDPADVHTYRAACRSAGTPATSAGASNSTRVFKAAASGLLNSFRAAGVAPRLTPMTAPSLPASTPLRLASSKPTR